MPVLPIASRRRARIALATSCLALLLMAVPVAGAQDWSGLLGGPGRTAQHPFPAPLALKVDGSVTAPQPYVGDNSQASLNAYYAAEVAAHRWGEPAGFERPCVIHAGNRVITIGVHGRGDRAITDSTDIYVYSDTDTSFATPEWKAVGVVNRPRHASWCAATDATRVYVAAKSLGRDRIDAWPLHPAGPLPADRNMDGYYDWSFAFGIDANGTSRGAATSPVVTADGLVLFDSQWKDCPKTGGRAGALGSGCLVALDADVPAGGNPVVLATAPSYGGTRPPVLVDGGEAGLPLATLGRIVSLAPTGDALEIRSVEAISGDLPLIARWEVEDDPYDDVSPLDLVVGAPTADGDMNLYAAEPPVPGITSVGRILAGSGSNGAQSRPMPLPDGCSPTRMAIDQMHLYVALRCGSTWKVGAWLRFSDAQHPRPLTQSWTSVGAPDHLVTVQGPITTLAVLGDPVPQSGVSNTSLRTKVLTDSDAIDAATGVLLTSNALLGSHSLPTFTGRPWDGGAAYHNGVFWGFAAPVGTGVDGTSQLTRWSVDAGAPPVVSPIVVTPSSGAYPAAGVPLQLSVSAIDPVGTISSYSWDLDGDGACDDGGGSSLSTTFAAGLRTIRACVSNDRSVLATRTLALNTPPPGDVRADVLSLVPGTNFTTSRTVELDITWPRDAVDMSINANGVWLPRTALRQRTSVEIVPPAVTLTTELDKVIKIRFFRRAGDTNDFVDITADPEPFVLDLARPRFGLGTSTPRSTTEYAAPVTALNVATVRMRIQELGPNFVGKSTNSRLCFANTLTALATSTNCFMVNGKLAGSPTLTYRVPRITKPAGQYFYFRIRDRLGNSTGAARIRVRRF